MGYEWVPLLLQRLAGIEPYEVRQVLEEGHRWPHEATSDTGIRFVAMWGRTRADRHLIVVLRETDVAHDWLIVGAKEMTAEQAAEYNRWEASRGQ